MKGKTSDTGQFKCGMPYNRFGNGDGILIIFQGLMFENKAISGFMAKKFCEMYDSLEEDYTIYLVNRRPGLPAGYTMKDIAADYAKMIEEEFTTPVDVLGVSTGGSIIQQFAADYPGLVRKAIIHSSAYTLNKMAKQGQMKTARLAKQGKWRAAYAALMNISLPESPARHIIKPFYAFFSLFGKAFFGKPEDPSDLVVTIEAEDKHDFIGRLHEIKAPTLVIAGEKDPFYTPELFRKTAEGIPDAKLVIYEKMGHPASGKQFKEEIRGFLVGDTE